MNYYIFNWVGCVFLFLGFVGLTNPFRFRDLREISTLLSLIGSLLVAIWAFSLDRNSLPLAIMECIFVITSVIQLLRGKNA